MCDTDEQIAQIGIGFHAIHLAHADQVGEAGPVSPTLVVSGEERIATVKARVSTDRA